MSKINLDLSLAIWYNYSVVKGFPFSFPIKKRRIEGVDFMKDIKIGQIVQIKSKAETGLDKTKLYFVKDKFMGDDRTIIAPVEDKANEVNFLNKTVPMSIISDDSTFIAYSPEETVLTA